MLDNFLSTTLTPFTVLQVQQFMEQQNQSSIAKMHFALTASDESKITLF